jgi:hypothetical protein
VPRFEEIAHCLHVVWRARTSARCLPTRRCGHPDRSGG